jgi:hypothetical protein
MAEFNCSLCGGELPKKPAVTLEQAEEIAKEMGWIENAAKREEEAERALQELALQKLVDSAQEDGLYDDSVEAQLQRIGTQLEGIGRILSASALRVSTVVQREKALRAELEKFVTLEQQLASMQGELDLAMKANAFFAKRAADAKVLQREAQRQYDELEERCRPSDENIKAALALRESPENLARLLMLLKTEAETQHRRAETAEAELRIELARRGA